MQKWNCENRSGKIKIYGAKYVNDLGEIYFLELFICVFNFGNFVKIFRFGLVPYSEIVSEMWSHKHHSYTIKTTTLIIIIIIIIIFGIYFMHIAQSNISK